ncbi:MAG TPA: HsdR family type I site-specific deoxyribonuclease, partial [Desulfuromonadales bacterium]|nr:HsdR family type I site-specific deoxyribonuclease [Desulfuromonadales bacterium]
KNHQFLGVNNAIVAVENLKENQGRLGVFWHTQGSGKSYSMVFFSQKVLRTLPGNWTFVIVTDRQELDGQIYKNFANCGVVTEEEKRIHAGSGEHLKELLREDHRFVFTLIQKFRTEKGATYPQLSDRSDIIVITDEAHRSQYDVFALNMRNALPNAAFIGFTGTPLMAGEELTRKVFGDYVSIYDFKQSVEDNATVPLYYENRIPELQLTNEKLNEEMERLLEEAELDEAQERKLEREFAREYHLVTRDERLEKVAEDVVRHFVGRGQRGKAMFIAIDKLTAVRMYHKVQAHWQREIAHLKDELAVARHDWKKQRLAEQLTYMEATDMAVVVSQAQNELELFAEKGIDFKPHRLRLVREDLEKKFKDPDDPFRLVFVCAMWITGFDVPCCNTIYLDKPMRNHTLMQTIARANRVFRDKLNGLIVDYVGVFRNMQKALAIYGSGAGGGVGEGECPVKVKAFLVEKLREKVAETEAFLNKVGSPLNGIQAARDFDFIARRDAAVEAILVSDESKKQYLGLANWVARIYKAILPDPAANEFGPKRAVIVNIAEAIRSLDPEVDITGVMEQVEGLLDESIAAEGYLIRDPKDTEYGGPIDISKIDFEALKAKFAKARKRTEIEKLKAALEQRLKTLVLLNRSRMDYLERFQRLIDEYNSGALNVEAVFGELLKFARDLNDEERRHMQEELSEEELALFDLLIKPAPGLTEKERKQVKKVARDLLDLLKREKLVLDWRKKEMTRAGVRQTIEIMLDYLPEVFDKSLYEKKCDAIYQHVYDAYYGQGRSVYGTVH